MCLAQSVISRAKSTKPSQVKRNFCTTYFIDHSSSCLSIETFHLVKVKTTSRESHNNIRSTKAKGQETLEKNFAKTFTARVISAGDGTMWSEL